MKKIFMMIALVATMSLASCGNAQKDVKVEEVATEVTTEVVDTVSAEATATDTTEEKAAE